MILRDGERPSFEIVRPNATFSATMVVGGIGPRGLPGRDGTDGTDGKDGKDGLDGQPGVVAADAPLSYDPTLRKVSLDQTKLAIAQAQVAGLIAALASKADLAGLGTAATRSAGDFDATGAAEAARLAAEAYADQLIANLTNSAPGAMDQLNELAAAMGNDPHFSATMLNALAAKVSTDDPRLTDQRVPTDGSVTDAKVATGGLSQSKVAGLVAALAQIATGDANTLTTAKAYADTGDSAARCKTTVYSTVGSFTWTKDPRAVMVEVEGIMGGNGGGSGAVVVSGTACSGGSSGGPGGYFRRVLPASAVAATVTVLVGAGGLGGAGVTGTVNTPGSDGGKGGETSFGGNTYGAQASPNSVTNKGGQISAAANSTTNLAMFMPPTGIPGANGAAGGSGSQTALSGVISPTAGAGGGISAAGVAFAGGAGGTAFGSGGTGGTGGTVPGGAGVNPVPRTTIFGLVTSGSAPGGGAASAVGNGGKGGDGSLYGSPGAGGGSCLAGFTSGKGGDGGQGILVVREWF